MVGWLLAPFGKGRTMKAKAMRQMLTSGMVVMAVAVFAGGEVRYDVTLLPTPGAPHVVVPGAINNAGQVVGLLREDREGTVHEGVLWDGETVTHLGADVFPSEISDSGKVVGYSNPVGGPPHAFLWEAGQIEYLGTFAVSPWDCAQAFSINSAGRIVGRSVQTDGRFHACLWEGDEMRDLGLLLGREEEETAAYSINGAGQVVGYSASYAAPGVRAVLWDAAGTIGELPTLGGNSTAEDINDAGMVVGRSDTSSGQLRACLWAEGVNGWTITNLGTLGGTSGAPSSKAEAINESNQVVGQTTIDAGGYAAFLWEDGVMLNLNDLIPEVGGQWVDCATGINDNGWIICRGTAEGRDQAFLLTPIPEPTTLSLLALLALSLPKRGGLAMMRRRGRQR